MVIIFNLFLHILLQKVSQYRREGKLALKHMWFVIVVRKYFLIFCYSVFVILTEFTFIATGFCGNSSNSFNCSSKRQFRHIARREEKLRIRSDLVYVFSYFFHLSGWKNGFVIKQIVRVVRRIYDWNRWYANGAVLYFDGNIFHPWRRSWNFK